MKVLTVYNSKGGVAKSTLVALLGEWLSSRGCRVVILDLDRQGSQSEIFRLLGPDGLSSEALHLVVKRQVSALAALTPVAAGRLPEGTAARGGALWVLQGGPQSVEAIDEVASNPVRYRLANPVDIVRGPLRELATWRDEDGRGFDYAILDMGPSDQIAALAGLVATDWLLIPTTTELLSLTRIAPVLEEAEVAAQENPALGVLGIVTVMNTRYFGGLVKSQVTQVGEQYLRETYEGLLLRDEKGEPVDIRYHEAWKKAMWAGGSLLDGLSGLAEADAQRFLTTVGKVLEV
jgi:chromosome partitioning protein